MTTKPDSINSQNTELIHIEAKQDPLEGIIEKYFGDYFPQTESQTLALQTIAKLLSDIIDHKEIILPSAPYSNPFQFKLPLWLNLFGKPGVGKSHLIGSFQNALSAEGFVSRRHFTKFSNNWWIIDTNNTPIVLIDDWFSNLPRLNRSFGGEQTIQIAKVLQYVYEHKVLLITGSNFDIMGDPNLAKRIAAFDTTGRLRSRMKEFANGQIEMIGPDYRTIKRKNGLPSLF